MKNVLRFVLKAAFTIGLLAWLLSRTDLARIGQALRSAEPAWILAAFALHGVGILISAVRWQMLLAAQGSRASLAFLTGSLLVGIFFNNFLPSTVGGDVVRARDTAPRAGSMTRALTVVLVERSSGLFALGFFALAAPAFGRFAGGDAGMSTAWIAVAALLGGFAAFVLLMRPATLGSLRKAVRGRHAGSREEGASPQAPGRVERLLETLEALSRRPGILRWTFLLAFLLQANVILHYWCIARSLGLAVPFFAFFLIVPVATVVLLLPVSINGIGAREAVFAFFLGRYGVPLADAVAFSWIAYGLVLVQGLAGGLLHALRPRP